MGRILTPRDSCRSRPERGVRSWRPRTTPSRSSGRSELERVRQTGPVGTALRRCERDVQGLSASHNRQFSTGTPTGGRNCRSGHRRKQYRRLYDHDRRAVPVRRPRPVRTVPRHHATNRRTPVQTRGRSVQLEANRLAVPTTDATAQPRDGRALSGLDRTTARRGRFNGVRRRPHGRTRDALVSSDKHQAAQFLGVPAVRRTVRRYRRGVRHHCRSTNGSVDLADVSELRFNRGHDPAPRHADVLVRLRGSRGSGRERDVPETARNSSTADGTARVP